MSSEELLTKVNNLFEEGNYNDVIAIVEALPESEKTYQLLFLLASSYSELSDFEDEDRYYQQKTLKILDSIALQGEHDLKWLYMMGRTYFNASAEEYAIEYFNKIHRICSKDSELPETINLQHFVNYCKECLYDRALAVIFTNFEEATHDKELTLSNIHDNHVELFFPKYNVKILIDIFELQRSGARLEFETILPDNVIDKFSTEGFGHTYEHGITNAVYKYITHFNENYRHYLQ